MFSTLREARASRVTRRPAVLACVMASMVMVAIEATIVATAMPQVVGRLGGFEVYSWVFSVFLLAQAATTVVFGKLCDQYGRRPVLIVAIVIFLVGSLLCGLAWSMPALIGFRLLQGLGAGAIQPVCSTIIGDLYSVEGRGKVQGYLSSVWGVSALCGPLLGGLIVQRLSWQWIFWCNIPVGLAAMAGLYWFLREDVAHRERWIDYAGAALFALTTASVLVGLTLLTGGDPGLRWWSAACAALAAVSLWALVRQERRAPEPIIEFGVWAHPAIAGANGVTLLFGMVMMGLSTFLPTYVQGVQGRSPIQAGFALTMISLGWPIMASLSPRLFPLIGMRWTVRLGGAITCAACASYPLLGPQTPLAIVVCGSFVLGLGLGCLSIPCLMIVQSAVGRDQRGAATASNAFARVLGGALGATLLGSVVQVALRVIGGGSPEIAHEVGRLLDNPAVASLGGDYAGVRHVLAQVLHLSFIAVFVLGALTLLVSWLVPEVTPVQSREPAREPEPGA